MNGELTALAALAAGFLGSGHCLGMCGGIAGALGAGTGGRAPRRAGLALLYNAGRVLSYTLAGAAAGGLAGAVGTTVGIAGWGPALRVLTGVLLVAIGLQLALGWTGLRRVEALGKPLWRRLAPRAGALLPVRDARGALALGFLWGWLPCGLVYSMLVAAALSANAADGAIIMAAFGLGTLPAMTGVALAGNAIGGLTRRRGFRAVAGTVVVLFGLWTAAVPWMGSHGGHGSDAGAGGHEHHQGHD